MVLCALHEPNYNFKDIIVAYVIQLNNYYILVSNCFISQALEEKLSNRFGWKFLPI